MILAFLVVLSYVFILIYAIKVARTTRSAFYAIAACAAAGLMLFQTALNIFGVTDILPLTGVTLPFISRGGSSIICSWGLLAFIKAADIRTYPMLSKTILPDHPLYPPDVKIGKRPVKPPRRPVTVPKIVGDPIEPATKRKTEPKTQPQRKPSAKDVPISKKTQAPAQRRTTPSQPKRTPTTTRRSHAPDVPISKKSTTKRRPPQ